MLEFEFENGVMICIERLTEGLFLLNPIFIGEGPRVCDTARLMAELVVLANEGFDVLDHWGDIETLGLESTAEAS